MTTGAVDFPITEKPDFADESDAPVIRHTAMMAMADSVAKTWINFGVDHLLRPADGLPFRIGDTVKVRTRYLDLYVLHLDLRHTINTN